MDCLLSSRLIILKKRNRPSPKKPHLISHRKASQLFQLPDQVKDSHPCMNHPAPYPWPFFSFWPSAEPVISGLHVSRDHRAGTPVQVPSVLWCPRAGAETVCSPPPKESGCLIKTNTYSMAFLRGPTAMSYICLASPVSLSSGWMWVSPAPLFLHHLLPHTNIDKEEMIYTVDMTMNSYDH